MVPKAWFKGALTATLWTIIRIIVMESLATLASVRYPVLCSKLRSFPNQLYDRSAIHLLGTTMDPLQSSPQHPGSSSVLVRWGEVEGYRGIMKNYAHWTPDTDLSRHPPLARTRARRQNAPNPGASG